MSRLTQWGLLTYKMHMLCDDALRAGFVVRRNGINSLFIGKKRGVAVVIYTTGGGGFYAANRADTGDLSVCAAVRTLQVVRKILGLEEA